MKTKIVRMNGTLARVPRDELTDPDLFTGEPCQAMEPRWPDQSGDATCTIAPHETGPAGTAHIAHDGEWNVIAIWWDAAAEITDQDFES